MPQIPSLEPVGSIKRLHAANTMIILAVKVLTKQGRKEALPAPSHNAFSIEREGNCELGRRLPFTEPMPTSHHIRRWKVECAIFVVLIPKAKFPLFIFDQVSSIYQQIGDCSDFCVSDHKDSIWLNIVLLLLLPRPRQRVYP